MPANQQSGIPDKKKAFVRKQKSDSFHSRYQVKLRRRREGKTNYTKRKKLVFQDKTKFNTPKYRFVVRISNAYVRCQIIWQKLNGDEVLCQSISKELPKFGLTVGLKNYSACYCTAFLCARRMIHKLGLEKLYAPAPKITGEQYLVSEEEKDGKKPFTCFLDIGLRRSTVGARVFAALKGACDGGLYIPHKERKFPGYNTEKKKYDPEVHRKRILGQHVADYMKLLKKDNEEEYKKKFSLYIKNEVSGDNYPKLVEKAIEEIKKNPVYVKKVKAKVEKQFNKYMTHIKKPLSLATKKERIEYKKKKIMKRRERFLAKKNKNKK